MEGIDPRKDIGSTATLSPFNRAFVIFLGEVDPLVGLFFASCDGSFFVLLKDERRDVSPFFFFTVYIKTESKKKEGEIFAILASLSLSF